MPMLTAAIIAITTMNGRDTLRVLLINPPFSSEMPIVFLG
jgi:hypothetical protein